MYSFRILLWLLLVLAGCKEGGISTPPPQHVAEGRESMIASSHPLAVEAGLEILRAGGNAVDAAIAVQFALAVVNPRAGNIGGGGFMLIRMADGHCTSLDYREKAPGAAHRDMYLDSLGQVDTAKSLFGHLAAGVPGTVAGMAAAHARSGSLPFSDLLVPAIALAEKGFRITEAEAERLNRYQQDFREYSTLPNPFTEARTWSAGDLLRQKALGQTLKRIQEEGQAGFYQGPTARFLLEEMSRGGGLITQEDLSAYEPVWRDPIRMDYQSYRVYSMPPPSSGGIALAQLLEMLEPFELTAPGNPSGEAVHLIAEAMRRAFKDRALYLGDADHYPVPVAQMLDSIYLAQKMIDFHPDTATASSLVLGESWGVRKETFETTHTSVVDPMGNAVAVTTTLNSNYGSKVWVHGAGFFLNNEMDDFSAKPLTPNQFGLVGSEANAIAPGKRMLSSMTPTIIEKEGELFLVLGAPGGPTIITSVFLVFMGVAEFGLTLEEAVRMPRFHHQWLPDELWMEADGFSDELQSALSQKGHQLTTKKSLGRVKAVLRHPDGRLTGCGDPRNPDDHAGGY